MDVDGPEHDEQAPANPDPPALPAPATDPDLERIAGDLADIERALQRLDDGSYWSDEVTGEALPDDVLAADPTARRTAYAPDRSGVAEADDPPPPAPA